MYGIDNVKVEEAMAGALSSAQSNNSDNFRKRSKMTWCCRKPEFEDAEDQTKQDCSGLQAVNRSSIATFGTWYFTLDFRFFAIADIRTPITGADFYESMGS